MPQKAMNNVRTFFSETSVVDHMIKFHLWLISLRCLIEICIFRLLISDKFSTIEEHVTEYIDCMYVSFKYVGFTKAMFE